MEDEPTEADCLRAEIAEKQALIDAAFKRTDKALKDLEKAIERDENENGHKG